MRDRKKQIDAPYPDCYTAIILPVAADFNIHDTTLMLREVVFLHTCARNHSAYGYICII
jgi:hypothetical protein